MAVQGWPSGRSPRSELEPPGGEERAALPLAVVALQGQQPGAPPFGRDAGALRRDDFCRRIGKVAQHLPTNGGVGVEQPVQGAHRPSLAALELLSEGAGNPVR